jgi:hypothetical protein
MHHVLSSSANASFQESTADDVIQNPADNKSSLEGLQQSKKIEHLQQKLVQKEQQLDSEIKSRAVSNKSRFLPHVFQCSLNVPSMFPQRSLNVRRMLPQCTLNVPSMFPEYFVWSC